MKKALVILLLVLMVGCSKKYTKAPDVTPAPEGIQTEEMVEEEFVEEKIISGEEDVSESVLTSEEMAIFQDLLFDYDKYSIKPDARGTLDKVADFLSKKKKINVVIEGHCDERGTNEYNLALGEKRARSAQSYLSSLGVGPSRVSVLTYGEEKPLCSEHDEACWQRNRRAHFVLVK